MSKSSQRLCVIQICSRMLLPAFLCLSGLLLAQTVGAPIVAGSVPPSTRATSGVADGVAQAGDDYLIATDDVLDVFVVDVAEMSRTYRVSPSGTISLPLVGKPLPALGLTLQQLSESIKEELHNSGVVMNAQVTVSVQQSRLHSVSVTGAVKKPQIYSVFGRTTLLDVISQAEGLADDAGSVAIIRRGDIAAHAMKLEPQGNVLLTSRVDIRRVMDGSELSEDVVVYPGDRVTIPRAGVVYVVGSVNKPGGYTLRSSGEGLTVMQAVALAADVKSTAKPDHAMIVRVDPNAQGKRIQIPVNLKKVLSGKSPDPILQAEDIVFVPDSTAKKIMQQSAQNAVQLATVFALYTR